jgi:hypothetical protein
MPSRMPPVPPANRSNKGEKSETGVSKDKKLVKHEHHANSAEEGDTANIKQNTTNKGLFPWSPPRLIEASWTNIPRSSGRNGAAD